MTAPRTLLQLAGADLNPAKVRDAALVLIDFQNEYLADPIAVSPAKPPIVSAAKLLAGARRDGAPVFHIAHRGGGPGVDVVYDAVGQSTFEGSLRSLHPRGILVSFGQASGPIPPFEIRRLTDLGSLFVTRPSLTHYIATRGECEMRAGAVFAAIASGALHVRIGARFPLGEAAAAHRALEGRATTWKVLLIP
jgi:NADPH2:quinone reductase